MEKQGIVSIWLGNFKHLEEFQQYLQGNYSVESDYLDSQFEKDYEIEGFDEDLREINYLQELTDSATVILEPHSYSESIIKNYQAKYGEKLEEQFNSIILLYNFQHCGAEKEVRGKNMNIKFVGCVKFNI